VDDDEVCNEALPHYCHRVFYFRMMGECPGAPSLANEHVRRRRFKIPTAEEAPRPIDLAIKISKHLRTRIFGAFVPGKKTSAWPSPRSHVGGWRHQFTRVRMTRILNRLEALYFAKIGGQRAVKDIPQSAAVKKLIARTDLSESFATHLFKTARGIHERQYYEFFAPVKLLPAKAALEHIPYELNQHRGPNARCCDDKERAAQPAFAKDPVIAACEDAV